MSLDPGPRPASAPCPPPRDWTARLAPLVVLALAAIILSRALTLPGISGRPLMMDYDIFHIVGLMAREGILAEAYHYVTLLAAQMRISGSDTFLPWAYPPVYTPVVHLLATLPPGLGYGLFMATTLAAWVAVMVRLCGRQQAGWVMVMVLPALLIVTTVGQNGYLTGALIGLSCLFLRRGSAWAGAPLGMMIIKPHLAIGLGLLALVRRDIRVLAMAGAVAAGLSALSVALYGPQVWAAFANGASEAGLLLRAGAYNLYRMTSAYATFRSLGLSVDAALIGHGAVALAVAGLVIRAARSPHLSASGLLGLVCAAGLTVSPYSYDYDLAVLAVPLALAAPDLLSRATRGERRLMMALCWFACGVGFVMANAAVSLIEAGILPRLDTLPSLAAPAVLGLVVVMARVLSRPAGDPAPAARPAAGPMAVPV
jgi:hypothetical protein